MRGLTVAAVAATACAIGLGACGGDEEETTGAATEPVPTTASGEVTIDANEYTFENVPQTVEAGKTSFTLNNVGQEEHMMLIARINEGHTFDEAIEAEGEQGTADEVGEIKAVKPGEESKPLTEKLKPGHYGILCFLPGPDERPHFALGQKSEFDVE